MHDPRPLVGVLCNGADDNGVTVESIRSVYIAALTESAHVDCMILPTGLATDAAKRIVARLDGVVLSGAESNVAPERYGARHRETHLDMQRDASAFHLIAASLRMKTPLLGICRGLQEMNVAFGGTLGPTPPATLSHPDHHEDLSLDRDLQYAHKHHIAVQRDGILSTLLGQQSDIMVNSLHHRCIARCALHVEARSKDGLVEAASIQQQGHFALGVQWHPEWFHQTDWVSQQIFRGFGIACRQHKSAASKSLDETPQ